MYTFYYHVPSNNVYRTNVMNRVCLHILMLRPFYQINVCRTKVGNRVCTHILIMYVELR